MLARLAPGACTAGRSDGQLLQRVALPSTTSFWYDRDARLAALKRLLDAMYATVGAGKWIGDGVVSRCGKVDRRWGGERPAPRRRLAEPPEPSDVLWENQEATHAGQYVRRIVTNMITLFLLVSALFITVTLSSISNDYVQGAGQDLNVCGDLGASLYGSEPGSPTTWFHIPPGNDFCPAGDHYLSLVPPLQGLEQTDPCIQPCFNVLEEAALATPQPCAGGSTMLARGTILKCFCQGVWGQFSSSTSPASSDTPAQPPILSYEALQACRFPAYDFFVSQIVSVVASVVTNLTNEIIRFAVPILVDWERHRTASENVTRLFIKSLAAMFLNTCGLLLLIHLRVNSKPLNELGTYSMEEGRERWREVGHGVRGICLGDG